MTSKHCARVAALALSAVPLLTVSVAAQTVEDAPTNCCAEVYRVGWELGRLQAIARFPTAGYRQQASQHLRRLSSTLQAANETCCHFCEAWSDWPRIQEGIRARAQELLESPQSGTAEAQRGFREWVESRPATLIEGLNRCDLEDDMPCKWLGLVDCARAYFKLGVQLGRATHALAAAGTAEPLPAGGARQDALESLAQAAGLIASLRAGDAAPDPQGPMYCDHLWDPEVGMESLLAEAVRQADTSSDAQLAATATEAHRLLLDLLVHGRPDLGVSPCPIGGDHEHADCGREERAGAGP